MTAFQQISDVLRMIDDVHRCICTTFRTCDDQTDSPQAFLLQKLDSEHARMRSQVQTLLTNPEYNQILRIWIQYIPAEQMTDAVTAIESSPSFERLVENLGLFYQTAGEFLRRICEQTTATQANEILADLVERVERNGMALTAGLNGMRDM